MDAMAENSQVCGVIVGDQAVGAPVVASMAARPGRESPPTESNPPAR